MTCFPSAYMYSGVLGNLCNEFNYILAAPRNKSVMAGKQLRRNNNKSNSNTKNSKIVTFLAVDSERSLVITPTSVLAYNLIYFGPRQAFEFPSS